MLKHEQARATQLAHLVQPMLYVPSVTKMVMESSMAQLLHLPIFIREIS